MVDKQVHEEWKKFVAEHEENKKLAENWGNLDTGRGGGVDGLKGFVFEYLDATRENNKRIDKGVKAKIKVLDNNGSADAVIINSNGTQGRKIQYKCGYTYWQLKDHITSGKYDGQILRINNDNPVFSNPEKLQELKKLAKERNIKIEQSSVSNAEVLKIARSLSTEGEIRKKFGMKDNKGKAVVSANICAGLMEVSDNVNKTETQVKDVGNKLVEKSGKVINYAQNAGNDFTEGAKSAVVGAVVPLTVEAISKMVDVAQGKVTLKEASKEMAKSTINVAVVGGTNRLIMENISRTLSTSNNPVLRGLANSGQIGQLVAIASIVQESAIKFVNGEITGEEFIEEIGKKGTTMVVGMIGGEIGGEIGTIIGGIVGSMALPGVGTVGGAAVGKVVAEILGTVITTVACSAVVAVFDTVKHMKDYKLTESHIRKIEKDALKEMENQREKFKSIMQREFQVWDEKVEEGFNQILLCACKETFNINGVTEGIDKILSVFGKSVAFHSLDEYEEQLEQTLVLKF